jgi:hypothetical protein
MKKQKQTFPKSIVKIEDMSTYELCRWAALKDAVDIIAEKCEDRKLDFETFELKPLDILKFVDSLTDDLYNKVITNEPV